MFICLLDSNAEKESKRIMIEFEALRREIKLAFTVIALFVVLHLIYMYFFSDPRNRADLRRFTYPPNVGDYCLAIFKEDNCLYRAEVIDTVPEDNCYHVISFLI